MGIKKKKKKNNPESLSLIKKKKSTHYVSVHDYGFGCRCIRKVLPRPQKVLSPPRSGIER